MPQLSWLFNGAPLASSGRETLTEDLQADTANGTASLALRDLHPNDQGLYTVSAVSEAGDAFLSFQVKVEKMCLRLQPCYV